VPALAPAQLTAAQQAAKDAELVKTKIAEISPEQLPDKDVALAEGVLPGSGDAAATAAAAKRRAALQAEQLELECALECEDEEEVQDGGAMPEEGADVGEHSLEALPWEFVITAEGLRDWLRLEE